MSDGSDTPSSVGAATLRRVAAALGVPVATLFKTPEPASPRSEAPVAEASPEEIEILVTAFAALRDRQARQRVINAVRVELERARLEEGRGG